MENNNDQVDAALRALVAEWDSDPEMASLMTADELKAKIRDMGPEAEAGVERIVALLTAPQSVGDSGTLGAMPRDPVRLAAKGHTDEMRSTPEPVGLLVEFDRLRAGGVEYQLLTDRHEGRIFLDAAMSLPAERIMLGGATVALRFNTEFSAWELLELWRADVRRMRRDTSSDGSLEGTWID